MSTRGPGALANTRCVVLRRATFRVHGQELFWKKRDKHEGSCSLGKDSIKTEKTSSRDHEVAPHDHILRHETKEGSYETESFGLFLNRRELDKGTVGLLDSAKFRRSKVAHQIAMEKGWTVLLMPPYFPWFSLIEGVFSIVKRHYNDFQDVEEIFRSV